MTRPRKRKLPPGVLSMADFKERKRCEQIRKNAREFMTMPEDERRRQLIQMLGVKVEIDGETAGEKKPGDEPPA